MTTSTVCSSTSTGTSSSKLYSSTTRVQVQLPSTTSLPKGQSVSEVHVEQWPLKRCNVCELLVYIVVSVRLANSDNPLQGRLEVLYRGHWGRVCYRYSFNDNTPTVACYMMGFG